MLKILLTWWLGYIGSHTAIILIEAGYEIIIIDNESNSSSKKVLNWIKKITGISPLYYYWDICNDDTLETIFSEQKIDAVIHFAARKSVWESMNIPFEYYNNNITWTQNLLRIMRKHNINNIIFSSTCAVYSTKNIAPYTEEMDTSPESVYWITKRIDEEMIEGLILSDNLLWWCILRYFNPIGNHESGFIWENPTTKSENIMPIIMEVIEWKREFLSIFGDTYNTRDGTCIRDYIHVMDLAEAHCKALEWIISITKQNTRRYEIINLGTGLWTTVLEIIYAVENALNIKLPYKITKPRNGDLWSVYGNCDKAKILLWRETKRTITTAIKDIWNFRKNNFKSIITYTKWKQLND